MKTHFTALTIAGSDSSGGAGIQADLKTFQALGCYGMSVITALTAQNTQSVKSVFPVSPSFVEEQLCAVLEDIKVDSIKIGMLFSKEIIEIIARILKKFQAKNIVLDPVMIAKSGSLLLKSDAIEALKELLFPLADLITPNIPEAEVLASVAIDSDEERIAGAEILAKFCNAVLIKGGHSDTKQTVSDLFAFQNQNIGSSEMKMQQGASERRVYKREAHTQATSNDAASSFPMSLQWLSYPRIQTKNTHGTGCTYSAAIAAYLAHGLPLDKAILSARAYVQGAIEHGSILSIGKGFGPVDHSWIYSSSFLMSKYCAQYNKE